jgi:acetyl/propionyl-CoA carboxylase alpha subunit
MVEKYIERPRHIEIQLLADKHGQIATLFERECSLQRRHQKVIEEAPSPVMTSSLWEKMRGAARTLATAAGYHGAGTVEFMVDAEAGEFYFLEVNARLQVEHPVTEAITGLDLVEHQLRIAAGERLSIDQRLIEGDRSAICGHAIEARVTAEDPAMGYLPSTGKILGWAMSSDPSVRSDSGYERGSEVSRFYDSLLAKVICHSQDRATATSMLRQALCDTHILGVKTNIEFMIDVLDHPEFASADFDTSWLGRRFENWTRGGGLPRGLLEVVTTATNSVSTGGMSGKTTGAFDLPDGFRLTQKRA